jgi:regulator of cell morphogenesis and NO signaling
MVTIDTEATLGDLVTAHPNLAREFDRRRLDYGCHGQRTLSHACREANLDTVAVVADLEAVARTDRAEPWSDPNPLAMVDHIQAVHHRYLWDELPRLAALVDKVVAAHGEHHPELHLVRDRFAELRADLEPHLLKEEGVLFPMIRELLIASRRPTVHRGRVTSPISVMMLEHDLAGELLARLSTAAGEYRVSADGCASYQALYEGLAQLDADTRHHIHEENNVLFPAVVQLEQHLVEYDPEHSP